jgi:hypothetical protein
MIMHVIQAPREHGLCFLLQRASFGGCWQIHASCLYSIIEMIVIVHFVMPAVVCMSRWAGEQDGIYIVARVSISIACQAGRERTPQPQPTQAATSLPAGLQAL